MKPTGIAAITLGVIGVTLATLGRGLAARPAVPTPAHKATASVAAITIDYPLQGSIFPPEITPPTFIWRDTTEDANRWRIDVTFADGATGIHVDSLGEPMRIGEIDKRCVAATNKLPELTPEQAVAHTWIPDVGTWENIKRHSVAAAAVVTITGFNDARRKRELSRGAVEIQTSRDPVGAPIFYRDVPLMPSKTEKGIIKPLAPSAIPLIQWRLRNIGEAQSRVVLKDVPTCANCHSFSRDGKTMGMDMDGPGNDKGLYAIVPVKPQMSIDVKDMVTWNPSHDRQVGLNRVGFMSQVSPDGQYVVTTVTSADQPPQNNFYVVNFEDYRFLQVFYPTRGILAWYSRHTGQREPLPGADDPRYVQTDGVWSPDGKFLVFARAEAKNPYGPEGVTARYANDPNEVQIQYDLYRIPFNGGLGGLPEAIVGASGNGMSNTFPKVSPDGRWIVFVECHNGQLMRPDSQLYIVPTQGGQARRMRCNTSRMNSWHSFSPNGRWLVFSSKSRSPYTQMYLTHIDAEGNDRPAILIDDATAANRAVNLPEFVNIPPDGMLAITVPAVEMYRKFDQALALGEKGQYAEATVEWKALLETNPDDVRILNNLGFALAKTGRYEEAIPEYEKALQLNPQYYAIHNSLGRALVAVGRLDEASLHFEKALEAYPESPELHDNLGRVLAAKGRVDEAIAEFEKAVEVDPNFADAHYNLGVALASQGKANEAASEFAKTVELNPSYVPARYNLGSVLYYSQARVEDALAQWREVLRLDPNFVPAMNEAARALAASPEARDRNGAEAVKLSEQAVKMSGDRNPEYLDTLAAAYAETGRFPEAIATARKALELATQQNQQDLAQSLNAKIKLYESHEPYRDPAVQSP
ncbi:MAG: tetratricopeptide repeat protein [Terriglobia bacterium]|jgi:tetratricopeptide (TPR) repeat protein